MACKVERYKWTKPGDRGRQCWVPVDSIRVDKSYQRDEVSLSNTLNKARGFDWAAFGSLILAERPNGNLYVVDGLQRLLAARHRGDIARVPCIVFQSDGPEQEAKHFLQANDDRKYVSATDKFRAAVRAKRQPQTEIAEWLAVQKLMVKADSADRNVVSFAGNLVVLWKTDADASKKAIMVQRITNGPEPLIAMIHKGLWYLAHGGVDVMEHADKLHRMGGRANMEHTIRAFCAETGKVQNVLACGQAILRIINHKRRIKVVASMEAQP